MSITPQPDDLAAVRAGYDRWAPVYDTDANPLLALEEPHLRRTIGDVDGLAVIDLGCGSGRHSAWLAAGGAAVTALDFSDGMLAEARRRCAGLPIRFVRHDLHDPLPLPDDGFDLAVSSLVLEHLRDLTGFFGQARRVLRSRGRAVVTAMHPAMFLRGGQARFTDPATGEVVQPGSRPHSISDFVTAASRAGFTLETLAEFAPDAAFAAHHPRAQKYIDWPMLVVLALRAGPVTALPASLI